MDKLFDLFFAAYTFDIPSTVIMLVISYWNFNEEKKILNNFLSQKIINKFKFLESSFGQSLAFFVIGVPLISFCLWILSVFISLFGYTPAIFEKAFVLLSILYDTFLLFPIPTLLTGIIISLVLILLYRFKLISFIQTLVIIFILLVANLILNPILKHCFPSNIESTKIEQNLNN